MFSGGSGALMDDGDPEAKFAARLLDSLGIAPSRIILEDRSRIPWKMRSFLGRLPLILKRENWR
jgi:hypothetical protein